ncbi:hypothetical protein BD311DRAFT_800795 [Dichomitus squalens]|uniref:Uncharacterized protein n=1 Tax=Dichomitus squalens TaxID=114155 RepID=A0A4Q9M4N8_9APHY|nr:hypothetical protein BD311DRAFT_800795 [Dichomitus squalens]
MYLLEVANRGLMATITLTEEMGNLGRMAQLPLLIVKTTLNRHLSSDFKSRNVPPAAFSGSTAHESRLTALLHIVTSERFNPELYHMNEVHYESMIPGDIFPQKHISEDERDMEEILNLHQTTAEAVAEDIKLGSIVLLEALQKKIEYADNERKASYARHYIHLQRRLATAPAQLHITIPPKISLKPRFRSSDGIHTLLINNERLWASVQEWLRVTGHLGNMILLWLWYEDEEGYSGPQSFDASWESEDEITVGSAVSLRIICNYEQDDNEEFEADEGRVLAAGEHELNHYARSVGALLERLRTGTRRKMICRRASLPELHPSQSS